MSNYTTINLSGTFDRQLGDAILALETGDASKACQKITAKEVNVLDRLSFDGDNIRPSFVTVIANEYPDANDDFYFISLTQTFNHLTDTDLDLFIKTFTSHYIHMTCDEDVMPLGYWHNEFKSDLHLMYPESCNKQGIRSVKSDFY